MLSNAMRCYIPTQRRRRRSEKSESEIEIEIEIESDIKISKKCEWDEKTFISQPF